MTGPLEIRILSGVVELNLAREIFDLVWPSDEGTQITANLLQALSYNGAYVSGAFIDGEVVAAAFAFPAVDGHGHHHLHSHMAAVKDQFRNQNIGSAIKWHQRTWAIEHGYQRITWTFDPLVRRNAKLNLVKLGVQVFQYLPNFYGDLPDALNAGDPTDRAIARWDLASERVRLAEKKLLQTIVNSDLPIALENLDGNPLERSISQRSSRVLCYLPEDIIQIRSTNPELALKWRLALRNQLLPRMENGWRIQDFSTDGAYVVTNEDQEEGI